MLNILVRQNGIATLSVSPEGWRQGAVSVDASVSSTPAKILEEAVYNSPSLLSDYTRIDVVADTERFVLVPSELASDETAVSKVIGLLWPDETDEPVTVDLCCSAAFLSLFGKGLVGFVSRTFPSGALHHRLAMLTSYFMSRPAPVNHLKLYAHFEASSRIDIVVLDSRGPVMVNSFKCESIDDAVYYIMAAVKDSGFDALDDEMIVCGDFQSCTEATDVLRQYINSVMPLPQVVDEKNIALELLGLKNENNPR